MPKLSLEFALPTGENCQFVNLYTLPKNIEKNQKIKSFSVEITDFKLFPCKFDIFWNFKKSYQIRHAENIKSSLPLEMT